ncbi:MAG: JAB domain-containing protein [Spirulina sp. DLM2.Bin59]|nr:MAG: JAB domain-containing protein [Spirulina sp. DLM2.Bin59]
MSYSVRMTDLPPSERPRERLLELGAKNLSNAELLAILLATGQGPGKLSAVGLGHFILQTFSESHQEDPLSVLRDCSGEELMTIDGIGPAKAATVLAAIELGKRAFILRPAPQAIIDSPQSAADALSHDLMWQHQERFAVLLLNTKNALLGRQVVSIGTATETLAHPRDIFREAVRKNATRLVIAHNHPSGITDPSPEDIQLTAQLLQGGQLLAIPILDHVILGNGNFSSLRKITDLWERYPQGD